MKNKLKQLRNLNGFSLEKMSKLCGVSASYIQRMERAEDLSEFNRAKVMSVFSLLGINNYDSILIVKEKYSKSSGREVNKELARYLLKIIEGKRGVNVERIKRIN